MMILLIPRLILSLLIFGSLNFIPFSTIIIPALKKQEKDNYKKYLDNNFYLGYSIFAMYTLWGFMSFQGLSTFPYLIVISCILGYATIFHFKESIKQIKKKITLKSVIGLIITVGTLISSLIPNIIVRIFGSSSNFTPIILSELTFYFQLIMWFYYFLKHHLFQAVYERLRRRLVFLFLLETSLFCYLLLWVINKIIWPLFISNEEIIYILEFMIYGFFVLGLLIGILQSSEKNED